MGNTGQYILASSFPTYSTGTRVLEPKKCGKGFTTLAKRQEDNNKTLPGLKRLWGSGVVGVMIKSKTLKGVSYGPGDIDITWRQILVRSYHPEAISTQFSGESHMPSLDKLVKVRILCFSLTEERW